MKTWILASAAMLTLGLGSAFAATNDTAQRNQEQVAMSTQASGAQTGSHYGQSFNAPANTGAYVGGWQPVPPNSMSGGD
jgi:hypothetical protein